MSVSKLLDDVPILFSTQTYLAWLINERYYAGLHYVWCAPVFDASILEKQNKFYGIPPSSSPLEIYRTYLTDVQRCDFHSLNIERIRQGLKTGAGFKLADGIIDDNEYSRILTMIEDKRQIEYFRPMMYVIPKYLVVSKLLLVEVERSANPLSTEFQIPNLNRNEFTTIQF